MAEHMKRVHVAAPGAATFGSWPRLSLPLLLGAALLWPGAGGHAAAQAGVGQADAAVPVAAQSKTSAQTSPAQAIFNRVNTLLLNEYGGLSTVDRAALRAEYQVRLDAVCAAQRTACPAQKAYPVLEAELTALNDEHSFFQTPEDFGEFVTRATGGERQQFGVKLAPLDGESRVVLEVVPGSAAADAGLRRGDVLTGLNGQPYRFDALQQARLAGATIRLEVSRWVGGGAQTQQVTLTPRKSSTVDLPTLSYVQAAPGSQGAPGQGAEVAVLRIPTFLSGGGVAQRVHDLVGQARARGVQGIVVDLRGNSGGSLAECDNAVSAFVPTVTRLARGADGTSRTVVSRGTRIEDGQLYAPVSVVNPQFWNGPVAVLVNSGSASCSEFFAYEIQYARRGPVVGEETAGVGNTATRVFPVGDAALQLTILNYAKPDGTPYPTFLTPDRTHVQDEADVRLLTQGVDAGLLAGLGALASAPVLTLEPPR